MREPPVRSASHFGSCRSSGSPTPRSRAHRFSSKRSSKSSRSVDTCSSPSPVTAPLRTGSNARRMVAIGSRSFLRRRPTSWSRSMQVPTSSSATPMSPDSGEGFGIVLAEAQLAGCVVIAPALDGSSDAIIPGVTGLRPIESSASSLRDALLWCLDQPSAAARIASNARVWSSARFSPDRYRKEVAAVLLAIATSRPGHFHRSSKW